MVWNLFPFKGDLGKARNCRAPNLGCSGAESPGWFDVSQKNCAWHMMRERARCHDEGASHQLPIAAAFWNIWLVSTEEYSSLTQNLMQIHCSTHSFIVNVTATQYTSSLNSVYRPHWLALCIPIHSPWLPCYNNVMRTALIMLTMAGFFPDRTHILHEAFHQPL